VSYASTAAADMQWHFQMLPVNFLYCYSQRQSTIEFATCLLSLHSSLRDIWCLYIANLVL